MPRAMVMVPSVAMKGGQLAVCDELSVEDADRDAADEGDDDRRPRVDPLVMRVAEIMQLMPTTEPIERSMLPVMST